MDPQRFKQVDNLLQSVLERPPGERDAFLHHACAGDEALEREVRTLLASQQQAASFLERPAIEVAAQALAGRQNTAPEGSSHSPISPAVSQLGPYKILAPIGAGGMGVVYRAKDPRLDRDVAIKIAGVEFSERSAREARLAAALNHVNICHIYDVGPNYLVMELVEGPTLSERLKQGPMPLDEALAIARQIAAALEAAHEKGIVHRDLKPGNIKIRADGTVKVLDFGLAKAVEGPPPDGDPEHSPTVTIEQATRTGIVVGTAGYMAPEQARGKPVDKRADIWAFGVVLYEMLSGRRLFRGETVSDTLAAVLTTEPDWSRVPLPAEPLLRRCLVKEPQHRLRDIGDAWFLLEEGSRKPVPESRSSLIWKIAAAALAVVSAAALGSVWMVTRRSTAPAPSLIRLNVDFGDDAALAPRRGASMALSPDGSRVVYLTGHPLADGRLAARRLDQPKATPLPGTDGAEAPFFSPDGNSIAFFADGKLKKVDAGGGTPVSLCEAPSARAGSWGDDDNIIFAGTNRSGLSRVPSTGGTPQPVTELDQSKGEWTHRYPDVLPGAEAVLFMNGSNFPVGEGAIEAYSFKTQKRKTLVQMGAYPRFLPSGHVVYFHRGTLFAAPMDPSRLELTGPSFPLLEDVSFEGGTGTAEYTFSRSGIFAYVAIDPQDRMRPIGLLDAKGKMEPLPVPKARYANPRVSPDGKRLAVTIEEGTSTNISIYEWAAQRLARFPFPNGGSEKPLWTPDGKYLAFYSDARTPGPGIYLMRADGTGMPQRLVEGSDLSPASFSYNSARLAYQVERGSNRGAWILPLDWSDAAHPKPGVPERFDAGDAPIFSHDKQWLAYEGSIAGTPELFVLPIPGPGGPWQISASGIAPVWSRTGPEIFYQNVHDETVMVTRYSIIGGSLSSARPRQWNPMRATLLGFDLMPDGKRIVIIPAAGQKEPTHATFLLNFIDDLRRRLPPAR
ncbi:MAG TPA: protein kinase [Bryobacteraceae bacterium]|nr:protein kinase [Bryobacteraceae bacterium]